MARDDREPDRDDFGFVDRDDDREDGLVDADYDDGFPGEPGEAMEDAPDPGFAAYADDFEDPLADWPSPDRPLDDIPPRRSAPQSGPESETVPAGGAPGTREDRLETLDEGSEGPDPLDGLSAFDDAPSPPVPPSRSDRDEGAPGDGWMAADTDDAGDDARIPRDEGKPASGTDALPPEPKAPPEEEDHLVDDFLNDLDDMDDGAAYGSGGGDAEAPRAGPPAWPDDDPPPTATENSESAAAQAGAAALAGAAGTAREGDFGRGRPVMPRDDADPGAGSRLIPWAMIGVVAVALVLLAVGGYGVIKQRGELEAQIRDLQAQLATAVTADEMSAERERQQQIALENESLAAEIEALQAENAALSQDIAALETRLEEQQAEAAKEVQRAAEAAAAAASARAQSEAAAKETSRSAATGAWFVNFGSYAERGIADRWAGRLTVDDGEVVVQSAQAAGRTLYRVRVIGLASQDRAERVATALERQYQLPRLWVGRN